MMRRGIANLPLHTGRAPYWLFRRMVALSREIIRAIVYEFGPQEVLRRLSDPFWFQALGCVLGFDWHSSGVTTTVCGAIKEGIKGMERDLGLYMAGGKGKTSRATPSELIRIGDKISMDTEPLIEISRITAKVDNSALQDGYTIYHHVIIFTTDGTWTVVQQGMNEATGYARRYHWYGPHVKDFVCEPHEAICSDGKGKVLNMVAKESEKAREITTLLSHEKPEKLIGEIKKLKTLDLPLRHHILLEDINPDRLKLIFEKTYEQMPANFRELLGMEGVGPKTIRALALISELVYHIPVSLKDPARYSFAHGGKDRHPYPVDRITYDRSIEILEKALNMAKIGYTEKIKAFKRLSNLYK